MKGLLISVEKRIMSTMRLFTEIIFITMEWNDHMLKIAFKIVVSRVINREITELHGKLELC